MYRHSKFIEILHEIRQEMAAEADYDAVLFAEMARSGAADITKKMRRLAADPDGSPDSAPAGSELQKAHRS